ncbi:MAG: hypothetical protein J0H80_19105, partial [Rhizobiales bacterium]|nr:hypothetical protein [Hyphomicrobiales bacterium]
LELLAAFEIDKRGSGICKQAFRILIGRIALRSGAAPADPRDLLFWGRLCVWRARTMPRASR